MTYSHERNPCTIAHRIEWFTLHEIVIARALPIVIPARAASFVLDMMNVADWGRASGGGRSLAETGPE